MNLSTLAIAIGVMCLAGPVILDPPEGMLASAWQAAGLAALMALWWLTEPIPLAATALLPLAAAPVLGLIPFANVASYYSHPIIILFLGGFLLAKAIEKWGLHQRLAQRMLGIAGQSQRGILAAVMMTTAFLSLWISNTASAMVIAPIVAAIAGSQKSHEKFGTALMLGVAFSATIGGMGSLIGTPPNAIFAAYVGTTYGIEIGFAQWAAIGLPVSAVLLVITWLVLVCVTPGVSADMPHMSFDPPDTGMSVAERRTAVVAVLTALAWIMRPVVDWLIPGLSLTDAGIAMIAAVALFLLPAGRGERLLDWDMAASLRWDVLVLFGGGLALAGIMERSGLASWIGGQTEALHSMPTLLLIFLIAALIVYVGELASNTAMAAVFLPVASAAAVALGRDPIGFLLPVALAASVGFMLPVATPPNAIVFGTSYVTRTDMLRAGVPLDVIGIVAAVLVSVFLGPMVFSPDAAW
ncbi:DASS family sodium-coupled anion symporter [uncultured Ruegeria sp.]|uniref:SLC13 family permease n=1 Tax=uncultured Ruegeria sp. TaxID=259304 RepID=UPI0026042C8F|nr:DASS family sodium-coupled anion symporter [uncultured Ruegeria sp.]